MSTRQKNPPPIVPKVNGHDATPDIEVVDDGTSGAEIETTAQVETTPKTSGDQGIEELRAQLAEERRLREAAERDVHQLRGDRQTAQREIADSRVLVLDATIQRQEGEKAAILQRLRQAKEAGDYDEELKATDELSAINIDIKQTKLGKARLESDIETDGGGAQTTTSSNDDPIEKFIKDNNTHPRAATWLRNHRDYALDSAKNAALLRAHNFALGHDGVEMNDDRYFELLEQKLGLRSADIDTSQHEDPQRGNSQMMPSPAPPSRSATLGGGGREIHPGIVDLGGGKYRVSPAVKEAADMAGITVAEYINEAKKLSRGSDGQLH